MIIRYFEESDMLYIELTKQIATESEEVSPNIVLDFDESGHVIGIEIEDASRLSEKEKQDTDEQILLNFRSKSVLICESLW